MSPAVTLIPVDDLSPLESIPCAAYLDVRLYPFVTPADAAVVGGSQVDENVRRELIDELVLLGQERASTVKQNLISQHGIEPGRLVICVNKYDREVKARPRVELVF
jgi:hypothetical protein